MRKIVLLVVAVVMIAFILLFLMLKVEGFSNAVNNSFLAPFAAFFGGLVTAVTSHPFWVSYGYYISFVVGLVTFALLAYVIWPRAKKVKPQLQQDLTLQREMPPSPPRQVSTTKSEAVTEEPVAAE